MNRFLPKNKVIVAGHRGIKALYPENTFVSFQAAIDAGVDMIETDLRLTSDGNIVVIHDKTVDRTTDGTGLVIEKTLEEIKNLDAGIKKDRKFAGQRVPALDEFLKFAEQYDNLLLNIEFKDNSMELVDKAMTLFREHKLTGRCVFASFYSEIVGYCYDAYGVRTQGFSKHNFTTFIDGEDGTISKMYAVGLGVDEVTKEVVADYEKNGIQPWAWCPDDEQSVKHCLSCGIKLLTCNDVAAALKIVKNR